MALLLLILLQVAIRLAWGWELLLQDNPAGSGVLFELRGDDFLESLAAEEVKIYYQIYKPFMGPIKRNHYGMGEVGTDSVWTYTDENLPPLATSCLIHWAEINFLTKTEFSIQNQTGSCGTIDLYQTPLISTFSETKNAIDFPDGGHCTVCTTSIVDPNFHVDHDYLQIEGFISENADIVVFSLIIHHRSPPYEQVRIIAILLIPPSLFSVHQCLSWCSSLDKKYFSFQRNDVNNIKFVHLQGVIIVYMYGVERARHSLGSTYVKNIQITGFEKEKLTYSQHEYQNAFSAGCICLVETVSELAPRVCLGLSSTQIVFQLMNWCTIPWILRTNQHLCLLVNKHCTLYDVSTNVLNTGSFKKDDFEFLAGRLRHVKTKLCLQENGHMGNCASAAILEVIPGYMQATGLENFFLPDESIKSTPAVIGFEAQQARLNNPFSHWTPVDAIKSVIRVYFGMLIRVTGILTQGSAPLSQTTPSWVEGFYVSRLSVSHLWKRFNAKLGNVNANDTVQNLFNKIRPCLAIRFLTSTWMNTVALRLEILSLGLYHNNFSVEYTQFDTEGNTTIQMFGIYQGLTCCLCEPDEGHFLIFGPSYCNTKFSMPNITTLPFLESSDQDNYIEFNHYYSQYNVHTVKLKQLTPQSENTYSSKISVNRYGCRIKNVYADETAKIIRSEELFLTANVEIVCLTENENYGYKWTIFNTNGEQYKTLAPATPRAFFPAKYFDVGDFRISVNISYFDLEVKSEHRNLTLHVSPSPLVVFIKGGLVKVVGNVADAVVDAGSLSYDPDVDETSEDMNFTWTCEAVNRKHNCKGFPQANGKFLLPLNNLVAGTLLRVIVVGSKDGRETNYTQILNVTMGDPPDISMRCLDNCGNYASSGSAMILMVDCSNCFSEEMSYSWELKESGTSLSTLNQFTETGINTQGLVILPGLLKQSEIYETQVTVGSSMRPFSSSVLSFKTNIIPFGGTCEWSPSQGIAGFTKFQVICRNWTLLNESTDSPATYITKAKNHEREFMLYINTVVLTTNILLPFGDPSVNHLLNVSVEVCNVYHDCTESPSTVQVLPLKPDEHNMTKEFEEGGKLWSIVKQNPNLAIEYVQVYASLLGSFTNADAQFVVKNLINALKELQKHVNTPVDCLQYALALKYVAQMSPKPLPLTDVISDCMLCTINKVKMMKSMDKAITMKVSDALTDVGGRLIEGIMTAPAPLKPDPINNQKNERLFNDVFTNMKNDGASVVKKLVPGGKASVATTSSYTLTREVVPLKNLQNKTWSTNYSDHKFIQSLNESKSAKGNSGLQAMIFKRNPLTWIQGVNSNNPVVSMLLYDKISPAFSGIQTRTKDTTTKRFLGQHLSYIRENCTFPICKNVIKFNITVNRTVVFFDLVPLSMLSWLEIYITWNRVVTDRRSPYDCGLKMNMTFRQLEMLNCSLMHNKSKAQHFPIKLDNLMPGQYCITIMYPGSNKTTIMFASFVVASCMLKNPNSNQWMKNMGDIHPDSTRDNVICNFNSRFNDFPPDVNTPWFMITDIFVLPNTINFLTVFEKFDLANNGAVFGSVIAIILLSLIVGLWARSADLRDRRKWKVLPIKGMDLTNEYYYCIIVSTGMMPKAGTTSKIYIRINFQHQSTDCLELDNGYHKGFDKGSARAFILPFDKFPGKALQLQIWHDSSGQGSKRNWFLNEILLRDVQTNEITSFLFNCWLGYEHERSSVKAQPANEEILLDSTRLFSQEIKNNFSEGHLWSSIFLQYKRSSFTRVQRLGTCIMLFFLMMITNAMWFDTKRPDMIKIGPFTPGDIFIMVMSMMIEVPVSLFVVFIFRRRRPKHPKPHTQSQGLPYWTIYIAWTIIILAISASGFFVILYSMEWGPEKANRWLMRIFTSFFLSLLFVQPVKVVIMAVVNLMKEKSANQMNDVKIEVQPLTVEEVKTKIWEAEQMELKNMKQPVFIPCADIVKLKQGVQHDKRVEEVKQNLTVYGVYLTILLILVYGQCDSNSYLVQKTMTTNVVSPFQKVTNISSYWKWVKSTLLTNLFPENIYERLKISPTKQTFLKDLNSYRFGSIRFRQKRQKQVKIHCGSQPLEPTCVHLAMKLTEDKTRYYEGWQQNPRSNNLKEQKTVWDYQETEAPMPGFFAMGQTTSFGSGGYIAHLEGNLSRANDMVNYLIKNSWCDAKTSAIFTEFVVYNPNVNLFCYTTMLVERFSGVFMPSHEIFVYRVQQNNQIMNTVLHVAYVGYIIVIACLIILMVIQARQLGTKIFFRLASWSEFLSLSLGLSAIVVFYLKTNAGYELSALKMAGPWKAKTLNFIGLNLLSSHILAALVFLIFLKIYEIFGASQWLRPMFRSMQLTAELLKPFSIIFCVIILAYALLFWAVFGSYLRLYGSLILSMTSVISALLGKSDFKQLFMLGGDLAAFLYLVFMFSFAILLFDVGILLVSEATSAAFSEDDESAVPFSIFASPLLKTYKALCELKRKKKKKHSSEKK